MGFLEDLGKNINKGINSISSAGKDTAEQLKLKNDIAGAQRAIKEQYAIIGELVYRQVKEGGEQPDYSAAIEAIDEHKASIAKANEQIANLKSQIKCPNCGKSIAPGHKFCPFCGATLVQPAQQPTQSQPASEEATVGPVCLKCGSPVRAGSKFCMSCGQSLEGMWDAPEQSEAQGEETHSEEEKTDAQPETQAETTVEATETDPSVEN
jgi:uncharacterized OB-fold protein